MSLNMIKNVMDIILLHSFSHTSLSTPLPTNHSHEHHQQDVVFILQGQFLVLFIFKSIYICQILSQISIIPDPTNPILAPQTIYVTTCVLRPQSHILYVTCF